MVAAIISSVSKDAKRSIHADLTSGFTCMGLNLPVIKTCERRESPKCRLRNLREKYPSRSSQHRHIFQNAEFP